MLSLPQPTITTHRKDAQFAHRKHGGLTLFQCAWIVQILLIGFIVYKIGSYFFGDFCLSKECERQKMQECVALALQTNQRDLVPWCNTPQWGVWLPYMQGAKKREALTNEYYLKKYGDLQ